MKSNLSLYSSNIFLSVSYSIAFQKKLFLWYIIPMLRLLEDKCKSLPYFYILHLSMILKIFFSWIISLTHDVSLTFHNFFQRERLQIKFLTFIQKIIIILMHWFVFITYSFESGRDFIHLTQLFKFSKEKRLSYHTRAFKQ